MKVRQEVIDCGMFRSASNLITAGGGATTWKAYGI
jgi:hypothetical protein